MDAGVEEIVTRICRYWNLGASAHERLVAGIDQVCVQHGARPLSVVAMAGTMLDSPVYRQDIDALVLRLRQMHWPGLPVLGPETQPLAS